MSSELQRIPVDGRVGVDMDRPRNVPTLHVQVLTESDNGATIEGHRVKPREPVVLEIYEDRADAVHQRCQTPDHQERVALAQRLYETAVDEWRRENAQTLQRLTGEDREKWEGAYCMLRPQQFFGPAGLRHGLPPLKEARVVHPDGSMLPLAEYVLLGQSDRAPYLRGAPHTAESAQAQASRDLATSLAEAIRAAGQPHQGARRRG